MSQFKISRTDIASDYAENKITAGEGVTITKQTVQGYQTLVIDAVDQVGGSLVSSFQDGYTLKVTAEDIQPDYLKNKLIAGDNVELIRTSANGVETLTIQVADVAVENLEDIVTEQLQGLLDGYVTQDDLTGIETDITNIYSNITDVELEIAGLDNTVTEHYNQQGKINNQFRSVMDGYASATTGLDLTVTQHYNSQNTINQHIRVALDGYAQNSTVTEHYNSQNTINQAIRAAIDGYATVNNTAATGDGYIAFFTGVGRNIAGDNDLYYNRAAASLVIGGISSSGVSIPNPGLSFGDGNTGFHETSNDVLSIVIGGSSTYTISSALFGVNSSGRPVIRNSAVSATNPTLVPDAGDTNTGIGAAAADQLSLIAGGVEIVRVANTTTISRNLSVSGGIYNTELQHILDGYALDVVEDQRWSDTESQLASIRTSLDGYLTVSSLDTTVTEHYNQQQVINQQLRKAADGYATINDTGATGDGYLMFSTGIGRNIAGDDALHYNRATSATTVNGSLTVTAIASSGTAVTATGNSSNGSGVSGSGQGIGFGVLGTHTGVSSLGAGVKGIGSSSSASVGVLAVGGTVNGIGLSAFGGGTSGIAVRGLGADDTGVATGGIGLQGYGGISNTAGVGATGVYGIGGEQDGAGTGGIGVIGEGGDPNGIGIRGIGTGTGYAGDFQGMVNITSGIHIGGSIFNKDLTQAFQSIRQALDGYATNTSLSLADGYIAFGTAHGLAGDNDLFFDRVKNRLKLTQPLISGNADPLVLGLPGDESKADSTDGLGASDVLVAGSLEVDNVLYADNSIIANGSNSSNLFSGTTTFGLDSLIGLGDSTPNFPQIFIAGDGYINFGLGSYYNRILHIVDQAHVKFNFAHPAQINPSLYVHSATNPHATTEQWISLSHDKTDGYITTGAGGILLKPFNNNVTLKGITPRLNIQINTNGELAALRFLNTTGTVQGGVFYDSGANTFQMTRNPIAGATSGVSIDSIGRVGIGTVAPGSALDVQVSADGYVLQVFNDGGSAHNLGVKIQCGTDSAAASNPSCVFLMFNDGDGDATGQVSQDNHGVVRLIDISDERVKTNIAPSQVDALDIISQINLIEYNRQHSSGNLYDKVECGFSGQNLQSVYPSAVTPIDNLIGVSRTDLIPLLVKSIQELRAEIEILKGGK